MQSLRLESSDYLSLCSPCKSTRPFRMRSFAFSTLMCAMGFAAEGCTVPEIARKPLGEVLVFDRG